MWNDLLPFVVIGLTTGSVYGLISVGLVLTYKTSGIFNFAHGSIAALSVFVFYFLHVEHGLPWQLAGLICLLVVAPAVAIALERIARVVTPMDATTQIVTTIGLVLIVIGVGNLWYGDLTSSFPSYLSTETFEVFGIFIGRDQLVVILVALIGSLALAAFLRWSATGTAMRGVVEQPDLLAMSGRNPVRVRQLAWVIGSMFATVSGLLLAPNLSLSSLVLTEMVIQAFGAAAIGQFSSLPRTYVGGLAIGVAGAVSLYFTADHALLAGLPSALPFVVLFVVLSLTPRRILVRGATDRLRVVSNSWRAPWQLRSGFGLVVVGLLALVPLFAGYRLSLWSGLLIFTIVFLSLGLLIKTSGQVSLCHASFMAVGAAAMAHLTADGVPWLLALLLAGLVAVPVGALVAIPAIRLSGVHLALATFGFGLLLERAFYSQDWMFGTAVSGIPVARPDLQIGPLDTTTDTGFYFVLLVVAIIAAVAVMAIQQSRTGRLLQGIGDSRVALGTLGANVNVTKTLVFCISAFLASIAGALYGAQFHFAVGTPFSYLLSLQLVALIVIVIAGAPWYALIGGAGFVLIPGYIEVDGISNYLTVAFGVFAATYCLMADNPPRVPQFVRRWAARWEDQGTAALPAAPRRDERPATGRLAGGSGLEVENVTVAFGGVLAVDGLSVSAPLGRITGLIGPNGAGKTTTFNACGGQVRPSSGEVRLNGQRISNLATSARARRGLGRTFQRTELFGTMTVRENIAMGAEASLAGAAPWRHLRSTRRERSIVQDALADAVELVGVQDLLETRVRSLTTGQRRLVELARVLAGRFDVLLLDEPSAGLDPSETATFGSCLIRVVEERGCGILLVEHDMSLVHQVCDEVFVMDFGRLIFRGSADQLADSDEVRAAYLGTQHAQDDPPRPAATEEVLG